MCAEAFEILVSVLFYNNEHHDSCVIVGEYNDNDNIRVVYIFKSQILATIDVIRSSMWYVPQTNFK